MNLTFPCRVVCYSPLLLHVKVYHDGFLARRAAFPNRRWPIESESWESSHLGSGQLVLLCSIHYLATFERGKFVSSWLIAGNSVTVTLLRLIGVQCNRNNRA